MARWGVSDQPTWDTIEAALAPKTRQSYGYVFNSFCKYIAQAGRTVDDARVIDVLSFLQEFVDEKRAKSTIRVANAALTHYFVLHDRADVMNHPLVKMHVKGAQNLAPVPTRTITIWDPEVPLKYLLSRPLPRKFRAAGQEALLLLLLATGIRVSDASRLGKSLNIVQDVCAINFLEARKTGTSPPQFVKRYEIPRLCPVRAIELYLRLALPRRKVVEKEFLFISSTGLRASVDTLRKWIIDLLLLSGVKATAGSCRSAASSAAILRDMKVDDLLLRAAGWKRESTFRRYYQRLVHPRANGVSLLPPVS
jgi:site-specific recombinase XerD